MPVDPKKFPKSTVDIVVKGREDQSLPEYLREYYQRLYDKYNLKEIVRDK